MMNLQSSAPVWIARFLFNYNSALKLHNLHPFLCVRMTQHQATGFHVQGIVEKGHTMEGNDGLSDICGMGNMKGASEGNWIHITLCVVARFGILYSIRMALV